MADIDLTPQDDPDIEAQIAALLAEQATMRRRVRILWYGTMVLAAVLAVTVAIQ